MDKKENITPMNQTCEGPDLTAPGIFHWQRRNLKERRWRVRARWTPDMPRPQAGDLVEVYRKDGSHSTQILEEVLQTCQNGAGHLVLDCMVQGR